MSLIDKYTKACNYDGLVDSEKITNNLLKYLSELKLNRNVIQLKRNWDVFNYPDIEKNMNYILKKIDALSARDARDALSARDALDARDARDAREALYAREALDAREAREARDARAARDARDALAVREAL